MVRVEYPAVRNTTELFSCYDVSLTEDSQKIVPVLVTC